MSLISNLKARIDNDTKQAIKSRLPSSVAGLLERAGRAPEPGPASAVLPPPKPAEPAKPAVAPALSAPAPKPVAAAKPTVTPAAQAPQKPSPTEIIATYERSGKQLADIPAFSDTKEFDLFDLARAFSKFGNVEKALRCLDYIPEEIKTVEHIRFAAAQYARIAQFDLALDLLNRVNELDLSGEARRKLGLERVRYLRFQGRLDLSIEIGAQLVEEFPYSIESKLAYAELLTIDGQTEEAGRLYADLIANPNHHISVAERYLDFLHETNRLASSDLLLAISLGKFKNGLSLIWRKCRHYWTIGDQENFSATCLDLAQRLQTARLPMAGIAFFNPLPDDSDHPDIRAVKEAIVDHIRKNRELLGNLTSANLDQAVSMLNDALVIGSDEDVKLYSDAITAKFPFVARGWYGRGVAAQDADDYDGAEKAYRKAIELDPSNPEHYNGLFYVLAARPDTLEELEELISVRNNFVPKFKDHYPDGRLRYYDHETFFIGLLKNDFCAAYRQRNNQPPNRFLAKHFPESYRAMDDDVLPETKGGTVCVIDQDGVGDEIRWAMYYDRLGTHFDEVQISCDPRLEAIFARSFPDYSFTPVARRWPSVPWRAKERREEIRQVALAGKLSGPFLYRLSDADRIMFPEEVAYHAWRRDGVKGPQHGYKGGYLKPDPMLAAEWKETLDADSDGKLKVGLLWRSALMLKKRAVHFMKLRDLAPLTRLDAHFVSLQPMISPEEENICDRLGVRIYDDLDLYDDFENVAAFTANLDLVIGISTLPLEMAGAVGTECWVLNFSSYGNAIRLGPNSTEEDINTANALVISGDEDGNFALPHKTLVRNAVARAVPRLKDRLAAGKSRTASGRKAAKAAE